MDLLEQMMKQVAEESKKTATEPIVNTEPPANEPPAPKTDPIIPELTGEMVSEFLNNNSEFYLQYVSKWAGKEIKSQEDLKIIEEKEKPLPEDVKNFLDFKINTGRGFDDFIKANKDWKAESKEAVVMEHMRQVDGLEGELLSDIFKLDYSPDEAESTENELKRAKARFEQRYKQALSYLEGQKENYKLPSQETTQKREAEELVKEQKRQFAEGMTKAVESMGDITIDDFKYSIENKNALKDRFISVDGILRKYQTKDGFDYSNLAKTLYVGENFDQLARAYSEKNKASYIEEEMAKMMNKKSPSGFEEGKAGDATVAVNKFIKDVFR